MNARGGADPEQCRAALKQVLESQTFARSGHARKFLKFVCEKALDGQGDDIKEYSIGVEALGKPADYSPADDSSVRRRAYEIRQRLEEFYSSEAPDAPVRIELPKGSYVPVFLERSATAAVGEPVSPVVTPVMGTRAGIRWWAALAAGILLGGAAGWFVTGRRAAPAVDPVVAEFWGPLLAPQSRTLICLGTSLYMAVRPGPFPDDPNLPAFPAPEQVYGNYGQFRPLPNGARLYMRQADSVAPIGTVSGVAAATNLMRMAGSGYEILPERAAPLASFRGRNVILFGDALTSFAAARELGQGYFTVGFDSSGTRLVIWDRRRPATDPPAFSRKSESASGTLEAYGLITALPSEGSAGNGARTFVISGVSNAGAHGAMEFLTSPERLRNLRERFLRQGWKEIPPRYQVVVKCSVANTLLLTYDYVTHEVIDPKVAAGLRRD